MATVAIVSDKPLPDRRASEAAADDARLVQAAARGDQAAFARLVGRYQDRIFNFALRHTGNIADAEEIAQDTFVKAYRALDRFRGDSKFSTWLFQIAKNLCINAFHAGERRHAVRHVSLDDVSDDGMRALPELASDSPDPQEQLLSGETAAAIDAAIVALDPQFRAALILRDVEGLDYGEIATILEVPVGTVKSRIHRARVEVQTRLQPFLGESP